MNEKLLKLKEQGYKLTRQRSEILDTLEQYSPLMAEDIYQKVSGHCKVNLSTIYRNLTILLQMGFVRKVNTVGQADCFELVKQHHCKHKMECVSCGARVVFSECAFEQMLGEIEFKTNYKIKQHILQLFGTCPKCQGV